jgi:ribosome-binding ATPase YchF (GTP1/OBG family)
LLRRINATLEASQSAASLGLRPDEEKTIRAFQLLTLKPEMVLVNVSEDQLGRPLPPALLELAPNAQQAVVRFELELAELPEDERQIFLQDFLPEKGVQGLSRDDLLRKIFEASGRIVFFTIGEDECRAWPIPGGANAVEAAAQIHTDLAQGFVRGEVVTFDDFKKYGSMKEAKHHGVYRLEGKTYILHDGDIMHVLAST